MGRRGYGRGLRGLGLKDVVAFQGVDVKFLGLVFWRAGVQLRGYYCYQKPCMTLLYCRVIIPKA